MSLDVYLYGERVGTLFPAGSNDYRLAYEPELVRRVGPGTVLLSNSLPARREPFSAAATAAYVEGLLPEGPRRTRMGQELGIDAGDGYLLLSELGDDCPGAVFFLPEGAPPPAGPPGPLAWLSEEELAEVLRPQPRFFGAAGGRRMRSALPGPRHKLSLVRGAGGRWAWPQPGAPSTHVVKPETGEYPGYVANEMFCTTVFREAGLPAVEASVEQLGGRPCLVTPRYDRIGGDGRGVRRLHCESFCQALGISPHAGEGTDEAEAPNWQEARGLLNAVSTPDELVNLITAALCNYMLGNGDAHGSNFALVGRRRRAPGDAGGPWPLAPLADITSTAVYDDPIHRGLVVSQEYDEISYLLELAEVAEECEVDLDLLRGLAAVAAERVAALVETIATRAKLEGWHEPVVDRIVELATDRAFGLSAEVEY